MRRNTVRLLKYLLVACGFVLFGPIALKYLFGNSDNGDAKIPGLHVDQVHVPRGMPESPDLVKRVRETKTVGKANRRS